VPLNSWRYTTDKKKFFESLISTRLQNQVHRYLWTGPPPPFSWTSIFFHVDITSHYTLQSAPLNLFFQDLIHRYLWTGPSPLFLEHRFFFLHANNILQLYISLDDIYTIQWYILLNSMKNCEKPRMTIAFPSRILLSLAVMHCQSQSHTQHRYWARGSISLWYHKEKKAYWGILIVVHCAEDAKLNFPLKWIISSFFRDDITSHYILCSLHHLIYFSRTWFTGTCGQDPPPFFLNIELLCF
jgi:hypothetical protein